MDGKYFHQDKESDSLLLRHNEGYFTSYMQKTCDVAEKAILAKKKIAEKVRKSRQNVNRDKSA